VRPQRIAKPSTWGAWKKRRALRVITRTLTHGDKLAIARSMGLELTSKEEQHND